MYVPPRAICPKSAEPGDGSPSAVRATIVMTARERHGLTERAIDSILRNTACPYGLVYADGSTPDALRERPQARAADGSFEVVRVDPDLWPTHVRRKLVATVDSDYVVFVDNDVIVEPGWLEVLIACADETGAGAVGPLYLIGGGDAPTRVHMAGGTLEWIDTPTGRVLRELHVDAGSDPGKLADAAVRAPCVYVEYHCVLVRTAAARAGRRMLQVNASGMKVKDLGIEEPKPGTDLYLTIDLDVQRIAEEALGARAGAVVAIDPKSGECWRS